MTWKQLLQSVLGAEVPQRSAPRAQAALWQQAVYRSYARLAAPSLCRPAGPLTRVGARAPQRAALRGLVVSTDERPQEGTLLELEVLAGADPILLVVEVEAVEELPAGAPSAYDVLLKVLDVDPEDVPRLQEVLKRGRGAAAGAQR